MIGEDGRITDAAPEQFRGLEVEEARTAGRRRAARRGPGLRHAALRPRRAALASLRPAHRAADLAAVVLRHERARQAGDRRRARGPGALPPREAVDRRLPQLAREHPALVRLAPALVGPPAAGLVPRRRDLRRRARARGRGLDPRPGRARHLVLVRALAVRDARLARADAAAARPSTRPTCSRRRATSSSSGSPAWSCSGSS